MGPSTALSQKTRKCFPHRNDPENGGPRGFCCDLRLSSLDLQLTALQSVLSILEHAIRASGRAEDQSFLQLQVDEVEELRQRLFAESIQVAVPDQPTQLHLEVDISSSNLQELLEIEDLFEEKKALSPPSKAMLSPLSHMSEVAPRNLPGMTFEEEMFFSCSSSTSSTSSSPEVDPDGSTAAPARRARRHTWGFSLSAKPVKDILQIFSRKGTILPEAFA
eukprot:g26805.t1